MGSVVFENQQQERLPVISTSLHHKQEKLSLGSLGSSHRSLSFNSDSFKAGVLRPTVHALERQKTLLYPKNHDAISFYKTQS